MFDKNEIESDEFRFRYTIYNDACFLSLIITFRMQTFRHMEMDERAFDVLHRQN